MFADVNTTLIEKYKNDSFDGCPIELLWSITGLQQQLYSFLAMSEARTVGVRHEMGSVLIVFHRTDKRLNQLNYGYLWNILNLTGECCI
jgi:hypothetical protein